ncbi:MAG TPA: hypothetical protein VER17_06195 [Tepidisphaeraceae bacterium]|nr:hypothetical protein [Tepidisphaeraceae bacterium]
MPFRWAVVLACALVLGAGLVTVRAEDKPADAAPAAKKQAAAARPRLTQPWNKITSLSDDQKSKIRDIHAKALDEIRAIRDKEQADILALLSDAQKAEAKTLLDEATAARKTAAAARKEAGATGETKQAETKDEDKQSSATPNP